MVSQSQRLAAVAPMMDWTDRHCRYLLRLVSPGVLLYTEMVTAAAVIHGDRDRLLAFDAAEHPLALQLGGSDSAEMAEAARIAEQAGYDEVNINVGCPSDRVQSGRFGACLMATPDIVAECVRKMAAAVALPVTVKCRIGIDDLEDYDFLREFILTVAGAGCEVFVIHARNAILSGLSPKQNREIPPLRYDYVHRIKQDFPQLTIVLNGGLRTLDSVREHMDSVDGVMIGREAYHNPWFLAGIEREVLGGIAPASPAAVVRAWIPYVERQLALGQRLSSMTRHGLGLFSGQPGARVWRRTLSECAPRPGAGVEVIEAALSSVEAVRDAAVESASG
ncbi:MAG: tRNA dihydrouridine(20/20a) synthase DusA [Gammaproteobacteria bacterium]